MALTKANWQRYMHILREWLNRSRSKGDFWWRKVDSITGDGDYSEADEGHPPHGAAW